MKIKIILLFGLVSGAIWATVPLFLSELLNSSGEIISVYATGAVSGILVCSILGIVLPLKEFWKVLLLGIISLPLGGFIFGVSISVSHRIIQWLFGLSFRFVEYRFAPLDAGIEYAVFSILSDIAIVLMPLAILTTVSLNLFLGKVQPVGGADAVR